MLHLKKSIGVYGYNVFHVEMEMVRQKLQWTEFKTTAKLFDVDISINSYSVQIELEDLNVVTFCFDRVFPLESSWAPVTFS